MKRIIDIILSLGFLLVTLPVTLLIALLIKIDSKGPVFFEAFRVGRHKKLFKFLKFRTMTQSDKGASFLTTTNDMRVTRVGKYLRLFKIDELPQLINVLKGDMSIVGPRPEVPEIVFQHYEQEWDKVLMVKPGLTCLLQIEVYPDFTFQHTKGMTEEEQTNYYLQKDLPYKLLKDKEYVEKHSLWLDFKIILTTIYCIIFKTWKYL